MIISRGFIGLAYIFSVNRWKVRNPLRKKKASTAKNPPGKTAIHHTYIIVTGAIVKFSVGLKKLKAQTCPSATYAKLKNQIPFRTLRLESPPSLIANNFLKFSVSENEARASIGLDFGLESVVTKEPIIDNTIRRPNKVNVMYAPTVKGRLTSY